jgi:hypothetical protein
MIAASAWSSSRGSPLPKPLSMTSLSPWPSARTQLAAISSATSAAPILAR